MLLAAFGSWRADFAAWERVRRTAQTRGRARAQKSVAQMMQAAFLLLMARAKEDAHAWFAAVWKAYSSCGFAKITHDFSNPENEGTHPGAERKAEILDDLEENHADCVSFLEDMFSLRKCAPNTPVCFQPYPCVLKQGQIAEMYFHPLATASVAGVLPCYDEDKGHLVWPEGTDSVLKEPPNSRVASLSTAHV